LVEKQMTMIEKRLSSFYLNGMKPQLVVEPYLRLVGTRIILQWGQCLINARAETLLEKPSSVSTTGVG
jgi:hypothetical protein